MFSHVSLVNRSTCIVHTSYTIQRFFVSSPATNSESVTIAKEMRLRLLTRTRPFPTYDPRCKQGSPHPLALASPPPGHLLPANIASFLSAARNVFAISVDHLFRLVSLPFGGRRSLHSTLVFPLISYFRLSCPRTRRWSGVRWKTYVSDRWKEGWPVNTCYATHCRLVCTHVSPYRIESHTHHHRMFWALFSPKRSPFLLSSVTQIQGLI